MLSLSSGDGQGGRARASRPTDPTHRPEPTRPTDPTHRPDHPTRPDTQREVSGLQSDASGCKGGKAYASGCKRMQAKKQGGRGQGIGARGKGVAALAKRRKRKKPWRLRGGLVLLGGLMRQGSFALLARLLPLAPLPPIPCPLPPCFCGCIPLAFRSHYGFSSPLHSARIRFSSPPSPFACLVGSGGRVGGSGRWVGSARGGGSGRWVGSPSPFPLAHRPKTCPPPPLLPPSPRGGLKIFTAAALESCSRFSVLWPTQPVCSNQIVNVSPFIGHGG